MRPDGPSDTGISAVSTRQVAKIILVAAGVVAALYIVYRVRTVIGLVLIGVFLAVALGPAVAFFERVPLPRGRHVSRGFAILITYLCIALTLVGVGLLVVPPIVDEIDQFAREVPSYVDELEKNETIRDYDERYGIVDKLRDQANDLPDRLGDAASALQDVTVGVFSALFQLITVLVITFFLLLDGKKIVAFAQEQLGPVNGPRAYEIADRVYRAVAGYVAGIFTIVAINGVLTYVVLSLLGIDFALPLAVMMTFFGLVPLVGATIGGSLIAIVCAIEDFPTALIVWSVWFIVYQQIENNILGPLIYRRTVRLHPLIVIVAILIGASLLGVLGALIAIPVAGAIQIVVKEWWSLRQQRPSPIAADGSPGEGGELVKAT
jgi:predicted PurR-regulated permease PerM